jgi:hypothetical protein
MTSRKTGQTFATVFAIVFAVVYLIAVEKNYALVTYHPATYSFGLGTQPPGEGPAMYWFGWMASAGVAATIAGLLACLLPEALTRRLWPGLSWLVPLGAIAAFGYLLSDFFFR